MRILVTRNLLILSIATVFLFLAPGSSLAAPGFLNFIEQGDGTFIEQHGFDCGVTYAATGEAAHADVCWFTTSPVGYAGTSEALLLEPSGTPNAGAISDRVRVNFHVEPGFPYNMARMIVDFFSEPDEAPPQYPPAGVPTLVEDGSLQFLNPFFFP